MLVNQSSGVSAGLQLSRLSLGGGPFGGLYGTAGEQACIDTVHLALKSGINYIDTAPWYGSGRSEEVLGKVSQHTSGVDTIVSCLKCIQHSM